MKLFFKIFSVVFHPIFLSTFCMAYILLVSNNPVLAAPAGKEVQWLGIVAYSTLFMPLLVIFLLWRLKFLQSFEMESTKERYVPLIACMSFYFWVFWIFHFSLQAPSWIQMFLLSSFVVMVLSFLFTIFSKISLHVAAISCIAVYAFLLNASTGFQDIIFLVVALFIFSITWLSRKKLQAHNNPQLITGGVLGIIAALISFLIY